MVRNFISFVVYDPMEYVVTGDHSHYRNAAADDHHHHFHYIYYNILISTINSHYSE